MAVYERTWRPYDGPRTPLRWRPLVITRYALMDVFQSRAFTGFFALAVVPSLIGLLVVYLSNNQQLIASLGAPTEFVDGLVTVFVRFLFLWQAVPAFIITVIVSPNLIGPDIHDHALPLYFSRPITRTGYAVGKLLVVATLLAPLTLLPGLLVYLLQSLMKGGGWWWDNVNIAVAYVVGHTAWITVISLLSIAIATLVRHKHAARGALIGILLIVDAFTDLLNAMTHSTWGDLLDPLDSVFNVVLHIFKAAPPDAAPVAGSWLNLLAVALLSIWILSRRLRPHEVVS